jgi:hypothetical protein
MNSANDCVGDFLLRFANPVIGFFPLANFPLLISPSTQLGGEL